MKINIPYSAACERNLLPISNTLKQYLNKGKLLEMGHGTGQHAIEMSSIFPDIQWYASDQQENHWILQERMKSSPCKNLFGPYELFVNADNSMIDQLSALNLRFDYFFTANTLHIMNQKQVDLFCQQVAHLLNKGGLLFIYGPFKFNGEYTSESNKDFDRNLKSRNTGSCIKDFEKIEKELTDFIFKQNYKLPANNQLLVFEKHSRLNY